MRSCLVPVVDDAGLHQIGDPVADRPRMAATLPVRPRVRARTGARNEELEFAGSAAGNRASVPGTGS